MKGCVLAGRFVFADNSKNARLREKLREKQARAAGKADETGDSDPAAG